MVFSTFIICGPGTKSVFFSKEFGGALNELAPGLNYIKVVLTLMFQPCCAYTFRFTLRSWNTIHCLKIL